MDLNITLCDDEKEQTDFLSNLLIKWAENNNHYIKIHTFKSSENFLFQYDDIKTDILISDIEMDKISGVALAKKIRENNHEMQIIFVSGYTDYITDGYDVEALNYLIKPVKEEKFFSVMNKAVEKLLKNEKFLTLETQDGFVRLPLYEIIYIESQRNYINVHGKENTISRITLKEIEKLLDHRFFKMGRSIIINLHYIHQTTKDFIILTNGEKITMVRGYYDKINRAFIENV